ncbi:hypothetical protein BDV96DRAFT_644890 [Lophiotrema nucula]|uniref:DUF427 domain-containing protein n=1 Tax=Lophiotrema nucula TaxID=690887 RepID=A0A6A5ZE44_9PLEO|nr:hypothetical protein BDV96DRAFT_644890 [Lophiotrema nucula]
MAAIDTNAVKDLITKGAHRYETGRKQVTLALGGLYIASTTETAKPLLVWESEKGYARYYLPVASLHDAVKAKDADVKVEELETVDGEAVIEKLSLGDKSTTWVRFVDGPFKDYIRFERADFDAFFENGALSTAIKNPYKRIDTTAVSRHITVQIDGELVAETNVAVLLNETGLSETYYLPATSVKNWGSISKSDLKTACPYKGEASYLNITVQGKKYENYIWYYPYPTHESAAVEGLISFYKKENVRVEVDGVAI